MVYTDRLVTSAALIAELESGDFPGRDSALKLLANLELLRIDTAVAEIVAAYDKHKIMPKDPFGDALHLALASYHRCDFLVTWNCQHLANARKFGHIRRVNGMLGLFVPELDMDSSICLVKRFLVDGHTVFGDFRWCHFIWRFDLATSDTVETMKC